VVLSGEPLAQRYALAGVDEQRTKGAVLAELEQLESFNHI
jgi:hypothetical protein